MEYKKITRVSKKSQLNNLRQLRMRMIKRHISPEERQKIIDNLGINIIV